MALLWSARRLGAAKSGAWGLSALRSRHRTGHGGCIGLGREVGPAWQGFTFSAQTTPEVGGGFAGRTVGGVQPDRPRAPIGARAVRNTGRRGVEQATGDCAVQPVVPSRGSFGLLVRWRVRRLAERLRVARVTSRAGRCLLSSSESIPNGCAASRRQAGWPLPAGLAANPCALGDRCAGGLLARRSSRPWCGGMACAAGSGVAGRLRTRDVSVPPGRWGKLS
jgi:hypothetical protein